MAEGIMSILETLVDDQLKAATNDVDVAAADKACSHQCGGHCCRAFFLPYSPEELLEQQPFLQDGEQIVAMVEHLGEFKQGEAPPDMLPGTQATGAGNYYRCRNIGDDGLCGIYEDRPRMCSEYPYSVTCNYTKCAASCSTKLLFEARKSS